MSSIKVIQIFVIFCLIIIAGHCRAQTEASSNVVATDWEVVQQGWPVEDFLDSVSSRRVQFYFYDKPEGLTFEWRIKKSFLDSITDKQQLFRISFKLWCYLDHASSDTKINIGTKTTIFLENIYRDVNYKWNWMPVQFSLSYDDLATFYISASYMGLSDTKYRIWALKDFQIEYQTQINEDPPSPQPDLAPSGNFSRVEGWQTYQVPPKMLNDYPSNTFIYFSSGCNQTCELVFEWNGKQIRTARLTFQYWIFGESTIGISGRNESLNATADNWVEESIDLYDLEDLIISVATDNTDSYAAISGLKLVITYADSQSSTVECKSGADCRHWRLSGNGFWSPQTTALVPNERYLYPTSDRNSLTIKADDNLMEDNVCLTIEYFTQSQINAKLTIIYNVLEENKNDSILEIRPGFQTTEESVLCLRDLLALKAQKYEITVHSDQELISNSIDLLFRLKAMDKEPSPWLFANNTVNYLLPNTQTANYADEDLVTSQWKQIHPASPALFTMGTDKIKFAARTSSRIPRTAILSSIWIKYNESLHKIDSAFSLHVSSKEVFRTVAIRPMICDRVSHCTDVLITSILTTLDKDQTITFKFPEQKDQQYIRLVFYVDYFSTGSTEELVEFDLKLVHFGSPCYSDNTDQCGANGNCVADPRTSLANEPECKCDPGYRGHNCATKDYCTGNFTGTPGDEVCAELGGCEPLDDKLQFRCSCNVDGNVLWDGKSCVTPEHNTEDKTWTKTEEGVMFPNNPTNSLSYSLTNINIRDNLCLTIKYTSTQTATLSFNYKADSDVQELAVIPLLAVTDQELNVCVGDFYYGNEENYDIQLSVQGGFALWNGTEFFISSLTFKRKEKEPLSTYLGRWDQDPTKLARNKAEEQTWITIPDKLFRQSNDSQQLSFTYQVVITKDIPEKAYLISGWIRNDSLLASDKSEKYYSVVYPKDTNDKYFKLKQGFVYYDNGAKQSQTTNFPNKNQKPSGDNTVSERNEILIPTRNDVPFQIVFEIQVIKTADTENKNLEITIQKLSLADPCYKYNQKENNCHDQGQCSGTGPQQFTCVCEQDYAGQFCELKNSCNRKKDDEYPTYGQYCSSLPSLPVDDWQSCLVLTDTTSKCNCPKNDFIWDSESERCVRVGYYSHVSRCEGKACPILDQIADDLEVSNRNVPPIASKDDPLLPFYYSNTDKAKLKLNIKNLDTTHDACFNPQYLISANAQLGVSYDDQGQIGFTQTLDSLNASQWFPEVANSGGLCVSHLTKSNDNDFDVVFTSNVRDEDQVTVIRFIEGKDGIIEVKPKDEDLLPELLYLTHWSMMGNDDKNYAFDNQWPFRHPRDSWQANDLDDTITFSTFKADVTQRSYLMSNWISKDITDRKLRFSFTNNTKQSFALNIVLWTETMETKPIETIEEQDENYVIAVPDQSTHYKIGFTVDYNPGQLVEFTLRNVSLGDPCVNDGTIYNTCANHGNCTRVVKDSKLEFECKCEQGYMETYCDRVNYCTMTHDLYYLNDTIYLSGVTGEAYCKEYGEQGTCSNDIDQPIHEDNDTLAGFGTFKCSCATNKEFWNINSYSCTAFPICLTTTCDGQNQLCDEDLGGVCECQPGYVNMGTDKELKCVEYDPCNDDHRRTRGEWAACEDPRAECVAYGTDTNDYMCVCADGFKTVKDQYENISRTECHNVFCKWPWLNDCDQICHEDADPKGLGYTCSCAPQYVLDNDQKRCRLNDSIAVCNCTSDNTADKERVFCGDESSDSCQCRVGYRVESLESGGYQCHPQWQDIYDVCPNGKANDTNNLLVCDCPEGFILDEDSKLCKLKPICGKNGEGKVECDSKRALCTVDEEQPGQSICTCPTGKGWSDNGQTMCADICEVGNRSRTCQDHNAKCNPVRLLEANQDQPDPSDYCDCPPGHLWLEEQCKVVARTEVFSIRVKNNFDIGEDRPDAQDFDNKLDDQYYFDLRSLSDDIKSSAETNKIISDEAKLELKGDRVIESIKVHLRKILKLTGYLVSDDRFAVKECSLTGDYYDCEVNVFMTADQKYEREKLGTKLRALCVDNTAVANECFILNLDTDAKQRVKRDISWTSDTVFGLTADADKLSNSVLEVYNNCESGTDICDPHKYSNCESSGETSLYNCTCSENFVAVDKQQELPTDDGSKIYQDDCRAKELCPACSAVNATCTQSKPFLTEKNVWDTTAFCMCPDTYIINDNWTECQGVCRSVDCGKHGECRPSGKSGFACVCSKGWSGVKCDDWHSYDLAAWIAAVSILGAVILILVIVVIYFARRFRAGKLGDSSMNVMSDYTQSSYRVGQNRNQNSGAVVNDGFTRD